MKAKRILAICLVMLLVAVAVPLVVSAATSQTWYLSSNSASATSGADYVMYKNDSSQSTGTVTVNNNTTTVWTADEVATVNVPFPVGDWDGLILLNTAFADGEEFTIHIGSWVSSSFTSAGSTTKTGDGSRTLFPFSFTASDFTVNTGQWLAFQIDNPAAGSDNLVVKTDGSSYVISPGADPGYPVSELPTIILFTTGLVGLAVYLGLKRRKRVIVRA